MSQSEEPGKATPGPSLLMPPCPLRPLPSPDTFLLVLLRCGWVPCPEEPLSLCQGSCAPAPVILLRVQPLHSTWASRSPAPPLQVPAGRTLYHGCRNGCVCFDFSRINVQTCISSAHCSVSTDMPSVNNLALLNFSPSLVLHALRLH